MVNKYLELKSEEDQLDCNLSTLESANYLNKELLKQIDALKDENHSVSWLNKGLIARLRSMLNIFFSYEKKMMLYVFNLKQLHWIQPYEDTNLKLMSLQSSMMIIPNQWFLVQQKWMLISQSTVNLSAQEKFPTEIFIRIYSEQRSFYIYIKCLGINFGKLKKILFVTSSSNNSWKVLKLMLKMPDQAIANWWTHIQRDWSYSQENSDTWSIKSDLILNRKKGILIKIN